MAVFNLETTGRTSEVPVRGSGNPAQTTIIAAHEPHGPDGERTYAINREQPHIHKQLCIYTS